MLKEFRLNNQVFSRLLISYALVLLLSIAISWLAYWQTIRTVEQDSRVSNLDMLRHSSQLVERYLTEINSTTLRMAMNSQLNEMLEKGPVDNYKMMAFLKEITPHTMTSTFLARWYIFLKKSDYVLFADSLYKSDFFYSNAFAYKGISHSAWRQELFGSYHRNEFLPSRASVVISSSAGIEHVEGRSITILQSLPLGFNRKEVTGLIGVLIDEAEFCKLLPGNAVEAGGWVYVADRDNRIIASAGALDRPRKTMEFPEDEGFSEIWSGGRKLFVTYITSPEKGWHYVVALPARVVMARVNAMKALAWGVTLISLIIGLAAAYFLAQRNAKPVRSLIRMVSDFLGVEKERAIDDYAFLEGRISELIANSNVLHQSALRQIPYVTATFFDRLFKGELKKEEEIEAFLGYIGRKISGKSFRIVVMRLYAFSEIINEEILMELEMTKYVIKDLLQSQLGETAILHDMDEHRIALLLSFNQRDSMVVNAATRRIVERVYRDVLERYQVRLYFGVGNLSPNLTTISESYDQARVAADYQTQEDKYLVWYHDLPRQGDEYHFPLSLEQRLLNFVKAGDVAEVERILQELYQENFEHRTLSPEMATQFLQELLGTVTKLRHQLKWETGPERLARLEPGGPVVKVYQEIRLALLEISGLANEKKRSHNSELGESITAYLHARYSDPGLGLAAVAANFDLTESYLSHFFKEQNGESFSSFLERLRMKTAQKLLIETELSIGEIAGLTGYYSDQVFRRAFKRVHQISPNDFRSQGKKQG